MDQTTQPDPQPAPSPAASPLPPRRPWGKIIGLLAGIIVIAAIIAGWWYFHRQNAAISSNRQSSNQTRQQPNQSGPGAWPQITEQQPSDLPAVSEATATPQMQEATEALAQIPNYQGVLKKYGLNLSAAQQQFLDQNHFLLVPAQNTNLSPGYDFDDMLAEFDSLGGSPVVADRKPQDTKLVTPDVMLEAYHKFFDLTLKQLEQTDLSGDLSSFLAGLTGNLSAAEQQSSGYIQQRYQNLLAQMVVARALFENQSPPKPPYFDTPDQENAYDAADQTIDTAANAKTIAAKYSAGLPPDLIAKINQELDLIYAATDVQVLPLFGQYSDVAKSDYTQYTPRSHYTETSALRAYFRTMMYLGRNSYLFSSNDGIVDANLLAKQIGIKAADGSVPLDSWNKIMAVTSFYAGQSDDVTYNQWNQYVGSQLGPSTADANLTSQDNIAKLAQNLNQLPQPKILSSVIVDPTIFSQTKADLLRQSLGLRVFGQRFTFDAWVLNDLTAGQEQTDARLPSTPSALFIPAAFGDGRAAQYSQEFLKTDAGFSDSDVQGFMGKLQQKQDDLAKITLPEWYASMGSSWLYVLGALTHQYGQGYPSYMQNAQFLDKQLQTYLGSYAELKHDTLLYAKQSYAEKGGGGGDEAVPPIVKGFVEPNLDFWNRFNLLLARTQQLFADNRLFSDNTAASELQQFQAYSTFLTGLAQKELQNQPISDDDYEKLRNLGLSFMAQPFDSASPDENSGKVALIADVHTDALKNQILYEAVGQPYLMLAVVGNENSPRLVAGLAFNHYEFANPLAARLSDQDWQKWVYQQPSLLPPKNFWYQSLGVK